MRLEKRGKLNLEDARKAAEVLAGAFRNEGVTSFVFDTSKSRVRKALLAMYRARAASFRGSSHLVVIAREGGEIAGLALLGRPETGKRRVPRPPAPAALPSFLMLLAALRWTRIPAMSRAAGKPRSLLSRAPFLTLEALAVAPGRQGRGIGRRLLAEVSGVAEATDGISGVYLFTGDARNRDIYLKAGYAVIRAAPCGKLTVWHMFRENRATGDS